MQPSSTPVPARKPSPSQLLAAPALPTKRPVMFELHIRPLFRSLDREHMSFALNLWKYLDAPANQRVAFYQRILAKLKASDLSNVMPPTNEGGPWPQEWLDLFERWVQEGAVSLERAVADPVQFKAVRDPGSGTVEISATGQKPSSGHVVWIERNYDPARLYNEDQPAEFILYLERRVSVATTSAPFTIDDYFDVPAASTTVTIVDANGLHVVNITV
jgi:hypothetical protein